MTLKSDLKPTGRNRVIDLVSTAGVDVTDWANFSRGPKWAAANPKFCYEWAFIQPGKVAVLNLWFENIKETAGAISIAFNMRKESTALAARKAKPVWVKRAAAMDELIREAHASRLPIRAIINDGTMRDSFDPKAKASTVERRFLDPVPWSIASYDTQTGQCHLTRGGKQLVTVDQFDIPDLATTTQTELVDRSGKAFLRDPAVRHSALKRANGRCEYCSALGFALPNGTFFLETHHIIPLSESGPDVITNVAGVCPNHHREAHFGAAATAIRTFLLATIGKSRGRGLTTA